MSRIWNPKTKSKMSVLLSARIRNFSPFPRGCRLGFLVWAFPSSQYCNFGKDKRKIMNKPPKTKPLYWKLWLLISCTIAVVHIRCSRGISRSLPALPAVHELTFPREASLGIAPANHITEGCAAVRGTVAYSCVPWKIPFLELGWAQWEILRAGRCAVVSCADNTPETRGEQSGTFFSNTSAALSVREGCLKLWIL